MSTSAGYPVLTFYYTNGNYVGARSLSVKYYLSSYTNIARTITMAVNICQMTVSSVSAQTYIIFKTALTFSAAYYSINPTAAKSSFIISYTVT